VELKASAGLWSREHRHGVVQPTRHLASEHV